MYSVRSITTYCEHEPSDNLIFDNEDSNTHFIIIKQFETEILREDV